MSTEAFRGAVNALIKDWMDANHSSIDVVYENGPAADQDKISSPWLDVSIRWHDGRNVALGGRGRGRDYGVLVTNVYTKEGEGSQASDQLVDGLRELLRNRNVGGGRLEFPARNPSPPLLGWYRAGLQTPFTIDSE
jgi:hypothetical protein